MKILLCVTRGFFFHCKSFTMSPVLFAGQMNINTSYFLDKRIFNATKTPFLTEILYFTFQPGPPGANIRHLT